jgi:hypothetical protein
MTELNIPLGITIAPFQETWNGIPFRNHGRFLAALLPLAPFISPTDS